MQVGLVGQRGRDRAVEVAASIRDQLRDRGVAVLLDESTADVLGAEGSPPKRLADCDLAVSIGGDGTFLYAARAAGPTPIMGINLGEVGFLNAVAPEHAVREVDAAVDALQAGTLSVRRAPRLRTDGPALSLEPAINEVLVQAPRRGAGVETTLTIEVDGATYASGVADGALVATPTGSTAYNLSEGGPLVHPSVDGTIVTPMFPEEGTRPLVVDGDASIELRVEDADSGHVVSDGRQASELDAPFSVTVEVTEQPLRIAGPDAHFFEALGKLE